MSLEAGAELPERVAIIYGEVSSVRHCGVSDRGDVAVTKDEVVAVGPVGVLGGVREYMEIEGGEDVRHAKGSCGVPTPCGHEHGEDRFSNRLCFFFEHICLRIGKGHRAKNTTHGHAYRTQ